MRVRVHFLTSRLCFYSAPVHTACFISIKYSSFFFLPLFLSRIFTSQSVLPCPPIIMTSSSPTPDIASLSLSSQPSHQRLHDTYDFDGTGPGDLRPHYHYATSPPVPPGQPPFLPLSLNQSPLKTKTTRAGLPSVRPPFFSYLWSSSLIFIVPMCTLSIAMARWRCYLC